MGQVTRRPGMLGRALYYMGLPFSFRVWVPQCMVLTVDASWKGKEQRALGSPRDSESERAMKRFLWRWEIEAVEWGKRRYLVIAGDGR